MKNIALLIKPDNNKAVSLAMESIDILIDKGCRIFIGEHEKQNIGEHNNVIYTNESRLFNNAECVVVFGGDGTIMRTAHKTELPILSVNLGRIGYMAELEPDELHLLNELVYDNFIIEDRMMLSCSVYSEGVEVSKPVISLNDIVLSKGSYSIMPEIEVTCNGEEVGRYFEDGLICATPTGSTAYSLSAGGSIVDPGMECFCVSHICPQSFYAKPMIFKGDSVLRFRKGKRGHGRLLLVSDGEFVKEIEDNDVVTVKKSTRATKLIKIKKNDFYSVMNSKMTDI